MFWIALNDSVDALKTRLEILSVICQIQTGTGCRTEQQLKPRYNMENSVQGLSCKTRSYKAYSDQKHVLKVSATKSGTVSWPLTLSSIGIRGIEQLM